MNIPAFLSYVVLGSFTPGPNTIMSMTCASRYGFRRGMRFGIGAVLGFALISSLSAVFGVLLFRYLPQIERVMRWVGAAYMLYLAWVIFRDKPHEGKQSALRQDSVLTGLLLQFVNAKLIMYNITVFTTFVLPFYRSPLTLALFVLFLTAVGFASILAWALFGAAFHRLFTTHRRLMNGIMALLLVFCAISALL